MKPRTTPGVPGYLEIAQEEIEAVQHSLEHEAAFWPGPKLNREINGCVRALHAIRNARTIVGTTEPPDAEAPEGSTPPS
jgi:hypothetical protein